MGVASAVLLQAECIIYLKHAQINKSPVNHLSLQSVGKYSSEQFEGGALND